MMTDEELNAICERNDGRDYRGVEGSASYDCAALIKELVRVKAVGDRLVSQLNQATELHLKIQAELSHQCCLAIDEAETLRAMIGAIKKVFETVAPHAAAEFLKCAAYLEFQDGLRDHEARAKAKPT